MKITFLGTGTSQGVPMIGCKCPVCTSNNPADNRLRTSIWIEVNDLSIIVDTGPDFRYQVMRAQIPKIDAVLYTHGHKDHVAGMDDIKAYNYWQNTAIDLYANEATQEVLRREFGYVFAAQKYPGIPEVNLVTIENNAFTIKDLSILPISVLHYKMEVYGFRIGDFVYITDANYISDTEKEKVRGCKVMVLNALRHEKHISHFTLAEALSIIEEIKPEKAYLTHISHQLGLHDEINSSLPHGVSLAKDGLEIHI